MRVGLLLALVVCATPAGAQYAYEQKYGPGRYNYDVSGTSDAGGFVTGNMDTNGRDVSGTIVLENGDEVDVTGEWVDRGEMSVQDAEGNTYDLQVD